MLDVLRVLEHPTLINLNKELWIELFRLVPLLVLVLPGFPGQLLNAYVYRGVSGFLHMQWAWIILHLMQLHFAVVTFCC